jgi:hypothetical protein
MSERAAEIDRLVRAVLAELGTGPTSGPPVPELGAGPASGPLAVSRMPVVAAASPDNAGAVQKGDLALDARLITLAEVAGRLDRVRRLVVMPGAVVTPAVRDELQRRNVALVRASSARQPAEGAIRLVAVTAGKRLDPADLLRAVAAEGVAVERHTTDCLIVATDLLAGEVLKPGTLGLLLTRHAPIALCLANRHPGVRAVCGGDPAAISTAVEAVGANLLVLDPGGKSSFPWKQVVGDFCRGGVRPCPETLRTRLG